MIIGSDAGCLNWKKSDQKLLISGIFFIQLYKHVEGVNTWQNNGKQWLTFIVHMHPPRYDQEKEMNRIKGPKCIISLGHKTIFYPKINYKIVRHVWSNYLEP